MELKEITDLINIRQYISCAINNFFIDKATVMELNNMLPVLDDKIINELKKTWFKNYIGYIDNKSTKSKK